MQHTCSVCGQPVDAPELVVNLDVNCLVLGPRLVKLRPKAAELLATLLRHYPNVVHHEVLFASLYGTTDDVPLSRTVAVYARELRVALARVGYGIVTHYNTGYRLARLKSAAKGIAGQLTTAAPL